MAPSVEERHLAVLKRFVIRARRVEEHSLAEDRALLHDWASAKMQYRQVEGEPTGTLRWQLPPEEPLDSLAARCRPFILQNDEVYWHKVLSAVGYFLRDRDADDLAAHVQSQRSAWRRLDKDSPDDLGYLSQAGRGGHGLGEPINSKTLAYAWLYGDLVHADDHAPERIGEHDIDDRYQAGAIFIARVATHVIASLHLVRALQQRGLVDLPEEIFTQRVTAKPDRELTIFQGIMGPAGTPLSELSAALDDAGRNEADSN